MLSAIICAVISGVAVVMSFTMSKKQTEEELNAKAGVIAKIVLIVMIFSFVDFFVAVNTTLFRSW